MTEPQRHWEQIYNEVPLCDVSRHFAGISQSPFLLEYLATVLRYCPPGGRTCETGVGSGYGAVWLSLRGICAEGIDYAPGIVERARQVNAVLGGRAHFRTGDLFQFQAEGQVRYDVVHHQGVLEHFTVPRIRAALARQVTAADWVVFSVPSVNYPFDPEFGDERFLPLDEWRRILEPFDIEELKYYGDPRLGGHEQILCTLRGQAPDDTLLALMEVPDEPYPDGISAVVHTRNEGHQLAECLQTLEGWTDEIIVCDMESEDDTVAVARRFTDQVIPHPRISNFDRARNVSAMRARFRWVFYLDADERVPPGLGPALRQLVTERGDGFEALLVPFRHHFAGHWMQSLYPGYTAPRLFKNGRFHFSARLHSGAHVDGRVVCFPADNPDLALAHYSFQSLSHYLHKLNRYTDGEAENMHRDGQPFLWRDAVRHFVQDFRAYYDHGQAHRDGVHGFLYSFLSGFYRFEQHAKLYERRYNAGQLQPPERAVPASVEEVLEYALAVARQKPGRPVPEIRVADSPDAARVVWSGPLHDPSGYGEESRQMLFAAAESGVPVAAQSLPWNPAEAAMPAPERIRLEDIGARPACPGFVHIVHDFPSRFRYHPEAGVRIGRTTFETDRLPADWVDACNRCDYVWVPTEFNRETFRQAGVKEDKLVVVPECLDPSRFRQRGEPAGIVREVAEAAKERFVFLSVFDWTLHKGWDVLLRSFLEEFKGEDDVLLVLKVWSSLGYGAEGIREQAASFVRDELGIDLAADARVRFLSERLDSEAMVSLFQTAHAYVMPSRGEGWGRPYMEAMACGRPVIGTNWGGNTAFMTAENSYLIDSEMRPVPQAGWREVPTYKGHRWAEPSPSHLRALMRRVFVERAEAEAVGARAREDVASRFSNAAVGKLIVQEIERVQRERQGNASDALPASLRGIPNTESKATAGACRDAVAVRWEGAQFVWHSLAHVNREFCRGLLESGRVDLSTVPTEPAQFAAEEEPAFAALAERAFAPLGKPADVHVRHFFPPRLAPPDEGHLVLMQPWEYGFLPSAWVEPIREHVSEVWCNTRYVQEVYRASGIPEDKLRLVPLGVDTETFRPDALSYVFTDEPGAAPLSRLEGRYIFLYVGGTLHRKGFDILLDTYLRAFSAYDDVCLVVKDVGTQTVYRGQNERERVLELAGDPSRPPIVYLEDDLPARQLAGIYTACDCLVQPYRGEGFCLPVLEAMACGLPVIVPEGGPTDDFVDAEVGWRVPAERRPFGNGRIGPWECVGETWMFEVAPDVLARAMRHAYTHRDESSAKGAAAATRAAAGWTWDHACRAALERIEALRSAPLPGKRTGVAHPSPNRAERRSKGRSKLTVPSAATRGGGAVDAPAATRRHARISLCMIVRNEERVLDDCLMTVKPWVDEIVVVDTGSTDGTLEIAERHGARIFHFPWCDDFSAARNESLKHATGDWILWMDADDTIRPECGRKLRDLAFLAEDGVTGFILQVHIPPGPGETGFTVVDHVKLFRNLPELRFEGRIHEQILEPIHRIGGRVERSDLYVVHSGYDWSPEGQERKRERDMRLLELDLRDRPDHPFVLFNIGMTAFHLRDFDRAVPSLERCLAVSKPHESTVRKVYAMLAASQLAKGDLPQAVQRLEQGLERFPQDPELLFRAGIIYRENGDLTRAEQSYVRLLTARETGHIDSLDVSMTGFKAHHNLALVYKEMGRLSDAEAQWRAAVADDPTFVPSWLGLRDIYACTGRTSDMRAVEQRLAEFGPGTA